MTCIVDFTTKKELKQAVKDKKLFIVRDPSFLNPKTFMSTDMKHGDVITVTNHPKRSWFAQIRKDSDNLIVK